MNHETAAYHKDRMNNDISYRTGYLNGLAEARNLLGIAEKMEPSSSEVVYMLHEYLGDSIKNPYNMLSADLNE
jgi:hypothetical protein